MRRSIRSSWDWNGSLQSDRLALRVVQLEVDPVHAVVLALQVGLTDELAAQAGARRLRRHVLGLLDRRRSSRALTISSTATSCRLRRPSSGSRTPSTPITAPCPTRSGTT